jgi:hypothetical protein
MMSYALSEAPSTTSENRVIPFPKKQVAPTTDSLSTGLTNIGHLSREVKEYIEGIVYSAMIRDSLLSHSKLSDPFGALYICDLQPDKINRNDIVTLTRLSAKIRDLSDEISFNDGMDD